jgi:hypothetical protein
MAGILRVLIAVVNCGVFVVSGDGGSEEGGCAKRFQIENLKFQIEAKARAKAKHTKNLTSRNAG